MNRLRRGEKAISKLMRMGLIYKLGGGRAGGHMIWPSAAGIAFGDCSWLAGLVCAVMGIRLQNPDGWTGTLVNEGKEGTSPYFTLYLKEPDQTEGHVIMRFRHHPGWRRMLGLAAKWRWAECGGRDNPKSGGGPTWWRPTDSRIAEFPYHRHFPEFDRVVAASL